MLIKVKVKPNAKEQNIEKIPPAIFSQEGYEGLYFVKLKALPDEGKANIELLKLLNKHFKKEVKIKSGFASRDKTVEVMD